tara:strand:- start:642 stop:1211 length:570 start_codon:yes stop_codon:yes gene_type:complete
MPVTINGTNGLVTATSYAGSGSSLTGITTGKILQVVEAVKTSPASTSTTTYNAISGLQPQITPSSSSNKVMIFINLKWGFSNENNDVNFKLFRSIGGTETEIFFGDANGSNSLGFYGAQDALGKGIHIMMPVCSQYLDSPNTTSQITYLIKWQVQRSNSYNYLNRPGYNDTTVSYHRASSSVTLMEVEA